ncbi:HAMP domain-containing histidine kinase [Kovacikia minuta CCNUW1]|uniref:sensor histidine kinase n=1 Tax=Kovacikia minuta TaxID=2931930 RepID=UPI001CCC2EFD|nr:HAMP domain-containing sensor histidine kinase [Kovacikia minuta]UBF25697.1 HAMP domain-containing histidine kinase [Kovacikia minuta CCNUW1]
MNWTNLIWLGLGFGFGLVVRGLWQHPARKSQPAIEPLPEPPSQLLSPPVAAPIADKPDHLDQQKWPDPSQQLKLAYRMATEMSQFKGGFLARASHELRSPLNGLIGMHQLILSDLCDSPEEEREFIKQANESARKMVDVLDRILDVARVQHGTVTLNIQPVQLMHILQEVQDLTHLQARNRNLQLQVLLPEPDIYVSADPQRLRQILIHLIDSAISRVPENGILVSTHPSLKPNHIDVWIDDHCPADARSEPVDLLRGDSTPDSEALSSGLNLLLAQTLLQTMQGHLEVAAIPPDTKSSPDNNPLTRIQCSIPVIKEEGVGN